MEEAMETLSKSEIEAIVLATVRGGGAGGVSREAIERVLEWAHQTRCDAACLTLVLDGRVLPGWDGTDLTFARVGDDTKGQ
jgi:hypothetical protein